MDSKIGYSTDRLIGALEGLRRLLGMQPTLWGMAVPYRSRAVQAWLRRQRSWLVEPLIAYAPELNPIERCGPDQGGGACQSGRDTLDEIIAAAERRFSLKNKEGLANVYVSTETEDVKRIAP